MIPNGYAKNPQKSPKLISNSLSKILFCYRTSLKLEKTIHYPSVFFINFFLYSSTLSASLFLLFFFFSHIALSLNEALYPSISFLTLLSLSEDLFPHCEANAAPMRQSSMDHRRYLQICIFFHLHCLIWAFIARSSKIYNHHHTLTGFDLQKQTHPVKTNSK